MPCGRWVTLTVVSLTAAVICILCRVRCCEQFHSKDLWLTLVSCIVLLYKHKYAVLKAIMHLANWCARWAGYRLHAAAARGCSCAPNSFVCLPCSCPASKRGSRVRLLIDAVRQWQDRLNWNPFAAGLRTAPIWLDTRLVRARQRGIVFSRQSNEHCLARLLIVTGKRRTSFSRPFAF
jgi:hypothetical protein